MPVLTYVPGAMGGSETYVRALVKALQERDDVELTVITSRAGAGALGAESEHVVRSVRGGEATWSRLWTVGQGVLADREARQVLRDADVVHYPFTVAVPRPPRAVPWVQTLLDVQHRDLPEMFSRAELLYRAVAYDAPARRANRVITISQFAKARIVDRLGVEAGHVDVAHLGVSPSTFAGADAAREPFVLYPATAWPHKNHARLVSAMSIVREERPDLRLVLTGGRREALGQLPAWVEHRGHVSDTDLQALYRTAACLVFPSVYEGFGLPPLEAMASGCPVAAADAGALPEICGSAAVLFDPMSVEAIAMGILRAQSEGPVFRAAGRAHVAPFTWEVCASRHVASYLRGAGRAIGKG